MVIEKYDLGDIVEMKRPHPCEARSKLFKIIRVGADIKLSCMGCTHVVMLTRDLFNKRFKRITIKADQSQNKASTE